MCEEARSCHQEKPRLKDIALRLARQLRVLFRLYEGTIAPVLGLLWAAVWDVQKWVESTPRGRRGMRRQRRGRKMMP